MNLALLLAVACTGDTATVPVPETTVPDTGDTATGDCATETGTVVETGGDSATDTFETGDTVETADTGEPIDTTPPEWCPAIAEAVQVGVVVDEDLNELSGLVESRRQPGVLWTHNDSGDTDRFFALARTGALLGTWEIEGIHPRDLEDLAIGPGPDGEDDYLYLGDVGDNTRSRDSVRVLRFPEPDVDRGAEEPTSGSVTPEVMEFEFHDGVARDSESIFVDPLTGDLYSVIKDRGGQGISGVFRAAAPYGSEALAPLKEVQEFVFGTALLPGSDLTTGADISQDGEWIVIRTYSSLFLWYRDPALPLWEAFEHNPCPSPLASEGQGEAVGFAANGRDYLTVSEGRDEPIWFYEWED